MQLVAKGLTLTRAYASVYGNSAGARRSGSRLAAKADVSSRVAELTREASGGA
jgi:hypothetical protein